MFIKIPFIFLMALAEIQSKELDLGPQVVVEGNSSRISPTQGGQKRYATKEVILYLTPTQIKDLQSGKAYLSPYPSPESTIREQDIQKQLIFNENDKIIREQFGNIEAAKVVEPAEVSQPENIGKISQPINDVQLKTDFSGPSREQPSTLEPLQSQLFDDWNQKKPEIQGNTWLSLGSAKNQEFIWSPLASQHQRPDVAIQLEKPLLQLKYGPIYNDQKKAIEIEKIVREQHQQEFKKQTALTQAEAIVNSPPILIHQEVTVTKHRPVPVVKHVKVPIPTPVLVPIPEPYGVNVPHPYPVPFEIIKHIPVPIVGTKNIEGKPVPFDFQKQVSFPVIKQILNNIKKFAPVEIAKEVPENTFPRKLPLQKAEKVTVLRPVWKY